MPGVRIRPYFFLLIFLAAYVFTLSAAEVTANLAGTVKDVSGGVVPGAEVTLTNIQTGISVKAKTDAEGNYAFKLVPVGNYKLTVEEAGFRKYVQNGIVLEVNQSAKQDVNLEVGTVAEVVEVTSNVAQVDTVTATLGSVETEKRIVDLPLVERDTFQLGLLQAGVFAPDPDDGSGNAFSVSGQRSESLTFLLDGVDNNDFLGNNAVVDPNPDAVEEFKILTNNYQAEYGRTSGGIVNQVLKSGTNNFHGSLFEFLRNDVLNANNYFPTPEKTRYDRNIFGGTIGGPIRKNKTFFFLSYQGIRRIEGQNAPQLQVLTPAERGCTGTPSAGCVGTTADFSGLLDPTATSSPCQSPGPGDPTFEGGQLLNPINAAPFTCFDGSQILLGTPYSNNQVPINPIIGSYIAKYVPLPNIGNDLFGANPIARIQDDQGIIRLDHHFSDRDTIYGNYIVDDKRDAFPYQIVNGASSGGNVPVGSGFSDGIRAQQGAITWVHTFSPTVVNEFIAGANRNASLQDVPTDKTTPAQLGFTNVNPDDPIGAAPPVIYTNSFQLGPNPGGPTKLHDVTFHWQDNISWNKGNHSLKFGADIRRIRNNFNFDFFTNGSFDFANFQSPFTGDGLADFVGGFPDNYFQFSNAVYGIRQSSFHFYGQDSWKIFPRFTLDLGLRYEYNTPQSDPHNNIIGFFPGQQSTVFPLAPPSLLYAGDPGTPNSALTYPDRNNFAPRFGFSWDMMGTGKFVMRGGIGVFYDIEDGALNLQFGGQAPFGDVTNLNYFSFSNVDAISDPFNAFAPNTTNPFPFAASGRTGQFFDPKVSFAYVVDPHFRTPYSYNFNYGFQYQLASDTVVEAYYVGSLGHKLVTTADVNFPQPSILAAQLNNAGFTNSDCARPLAGCTDPTDPNSSLRDAGQLLTDHSNGNSSSHELQLTVDKRFSHGFGLRGAYTLSKTIDNQSGFRARSSLQTNPFSLGFDRALADFDATHRLVISGSWLLPIDKPFRNGNALMKHIAEGWQLNTIISFQSGNPFTIFSDDDQSLQDTGLDRADLIGKQRTFNPRTMRTFNSGNCDGNQGLPGHYYFDPTAYDCVNIPLFTFGNVGRNSIRGPGINNVDLSLLKTFNIGERANVQFRTEFFNAFNHTQFLISGNSDTAFGFTSTFGQVTQARDPRIVQFALKVGF